MTISSRQHPVLLLLLIMLVLSGLPSGGLAADAAAPLARAHAHNDYEHARPLLDALAHGFTSVEADIFLVGGELLVAHNREDVRPERTLEALYLAPLAARAQANGGSIYPGGGRFILLIDFKSGGEETYPVLKRALEGRRDLFTSFKDGKVREGAVTAILSGASPKAILAAETERLAFIDGRPGDLESNPPSSLAPLVSENWRSMFQWRGLGPMPEDQRAKLRAFVAKAHEQNRLVRFWGTADRKEVWEELLAAEVDLINADNLAGLRDFLKNSQKR